jgi:hypothetical protein
MFYILQSSQEVVGFLAVMLEVPLKDQLRVFVLQLHKVLILINHDARIMVVLGANHIMECKKMLQQTLKIKNFQRLLQDLYLAYYGENRIFLKA